MSQLRFWHSILFTLQYDFYNEILNLQFLFTFLRPTLGCNGTSLDISPLDEGHSRISEFSVENSCVHDTGSGLYATSGWHENIVWLHGKWKPEVSEGSSYADKLLLVTNKRSAVIFYVAELSWLLSVLCRTAYVLPHVKPRNGSPESVVDVHTWLNFSPNTICFNL